MKKQLALVHEFHVKTKSYWQANSSSHIPDSIKQSRITLIKEEAEEVIQAIQSEPIENIAKELTDLLYVTLGAFEAFGLSKHTEAIFDAVHQSNMTKVNDKGEMKINSKGKVEKGKRYQEPDIKKILSS